MIKLNKVNLERRVDKMGQKNRIEKIKRKYGSRCFKSWGASGGNPVLIAQGQGRKIIIK